MVQTEKISQFPRHSIMKTIWLHLFPGVLIVSLYYLITPFIIDNGFPSNVSILLCLLAVIIPFELGHLYFIGRKQNKKFSLKGVIFFRNKIKPLHFVLILLVLYAGTVGIVTLLQRFDVLDVREYFAFLPEWIFYGENLSDFSKSILIFSAIFRLIADGIIIPIIEELYFRGYLLPRLSHFKYAAPIIGAFLFALYHLWQPWNIIMLVVVSLIYSFAAWFTKSFYVTLALHSMVNFIAAFIFLISLL